MCQDLTELTGPSSTGAPLCILFVHLPFCWLSSVCPRLLDIGRFLLLGTVVPVALEEKVCNEKFTSWNDKSAGMNSAKCLKSWFLRPWILYFTLHRYQCRCPNTFAEMKSWAIFPLQPSFFRLEFCLADCAPLETFLKSFLLGTMLKDCFHQIVHVTLIRSFVHFSSLPQVW